MSLGARHIIIHVVLYNRYHKLSRQGSNMDSCSSSVYVKMCRSNAQVTNMAEKSLFFCFVCLMPTDNLKLL